MDFSPASRITTGRGTRCPSTMRSTVTFKSIVGNSRILRFGT